MGMGLVDERGDDNVEDEFEWAVMNGIKKPVPRMVTPE
jgi:hypothetical protein